MARLPLYAITLLLSSASYLLLCASYDRLTPGEFISLNETLASTGGAFALGFFSLTNSTTDLYVGMWYNNIPEKSVIWVANREKPIIDSSATLRISDDSNLVVVDAKGGLLWSSNLSGLGEPGSEAAAVLLNSGNLVLQADSNSMLWQSIDHPTDTILPGMKIQYNRSSHSAIYITSWKEADDPSPGDYSFGVDPITCLQGLVWWKSKPYWRTQVWTGNSFTGNRLPNSNSMGYIAVIADEDAISVTPTVSDGSPHIRYTMNYSGRVELLIWDDSSKHWRTYWSTPKDGCERYGWCGGFAYCDTTSSVPECRCLGGFEPKVESEWESGKNSAGCIRKKALRCGDDGDGFVRVGSMKLPDHFVSLNITNISGCRSQCLANCSCTAYAYSDLPAGNATISRCLVWMGELIDNMISSAGQDLYLRLMGSSLDSKGDSNESE
ncbi:serine threonine-protein kinase [Musa troglodytarum]|uniref:non-specific serine/threonine protein kinase n=1 Tax=Musa troglodytarum TaxID=320322 RepID=A0A9E7H8F2_9LILI|nr:serine threonine-protein kinase [Musa troglodytarum]